MSIFLAIEATNVGQRICGNESKYVLTKKKAIRKENGIVSSKFMPRDTVEVAAVAMNHE